MPLLGEIVRMNLQLWDGAPNKFVRAFVYDSAGNAFFAYPFVELSHIGNGLYINNEIPFPPGTPQLKMSYVVYDDAGYTIESRKYSRSADVFDLDNPNKILIVNESNIVGTLISGSLVGQLLESKDDILPGHNGVDGIVQGDLLC